MSEQKETPVTKINSGRCRIVSKWKTNEPISQHEGETDLQSGASQVPLNLLSTSQGQAAFPDSVYLLASVIFQNSHQEKPAGRQLVRYGEGKGLPLPQVKDEMLRPAYELAFNTLICKRLLMQVVFLINACLRMHKANHAF